MQRCIFNEIVEGTVPAYKIYEDELYLAFLDVFPRSRGHALLVPKKQYRWTYEVPDFGGYWNTALTVTQLMQKNLQPIWFNYFTYGTVPYAHIHILPRYDDIEVGDDQVAPPVKELSKEELEQIAKTIRGEV